MYKKGKEKILTLANFSKIVVTRNNKYESLENNSELKLTVVMLFVSLIFPVIV